MARAKSPVVGQEAPDFTLPGVQLVDDDVVRRDITLSALRGSPVLLVFYPGDETAGCTAQLCSYSSGLGAFDELGAEVVAVSRQGLESHEHFARKERLSMPLLADTEGTVIDRYGVSLAGLTARRSEFLIDAAGIVRYRRIGIVGVTWTKPEELVAELAKLAA
ncbi:peroxiredoxin family protein [Agromyces archimandritae]|uniref:thioredoxin-dependent peroxiredoxin n=1 Tax=Agromyces archimandritae TaxID=2781962 RepID=A0A975FNG6_9MICO|nr:peroxiredoxin family protein [Agromyces archimandritae]QTX04246.1 peroxiredoxin [Agromyces archimandritae]